MAYKRGIREERKIVNFLESKGLKAFRISGSGAGTGRDLTDVVAGDGVNHYAIEVKSSKRDRIDISSEQVEELRRFSKSFGAMPLVCVLFYRMSPVFIRLSWLSATRGGNYSFKKENAEYILNKNLSYF